MSSRFACSMRHCSTNCPIGQPRLTRKPRESCRTERSQSPASSASDGGFPSCLTRSSIRLSRQAANPLSVAERASSAQYRRSSMASCEAISSRSISLAKPGFRTSLARRSSRQCMFFSRTSRPASSRDSVHSRSPSNHFDMSAGLIRHTMEVSVPLPLRACITSPGGTKNSSPICSKRCARQRLG
jgi:hypothetical protein